MTRMILILTLVLATAPATASDTLRAILQSWQPISVERQAEDLLIVLDELQVSQDLYVAVITLGVCPVLALDETALDGVKQIGVLNRYASIGLVAEGGRELCEKINAAETSPRKDGWGVMAENKSILLTATRTRTRTK